VTTHELEEDFSAQLSRGAVAELLRRVAGTLAARTKGGPVSAQCDSCGRFCRPTYRSWEHPEYGLQSTYCLDCKPRAAAAAEGEKP